MVIPPITVVIPCRNEAGTIGGLLDDLAVQGIDGLSVVIADGESQDGTWELLQRRQAAATDPFRLILVQNPDRTIPHAINRAVEAAPDGIIIRLDAHGRIGAGHLHAIAQAIGQRTDLLVGPRIVMVPSGPGTLAAVITAVLNSQVGNGGTPSRGEIATALPVAHTVMSCWHRVVWERVGGFDESLLSNEDFAFDWTARTRGCEVVSLPSPVYRLEARPTLVALARQRWRYGWWKAAVLKRHPRSLHLRQLLPAIQLLAIAPLAVWAPIWLAGLAATWVVLIWILVLPGVIRTRAIGVLAAMMLAPPVAAVVQLVWAAGLLAGVVCNHPGRPRPGARSANQNVAKRESHTAPAALWTRDHDPGAAAGRPRIIAQLRAGPLRSARHVRLHHAYELGRGQQALTGLRWLWRLATFRPEPLQCALYAAPAALRTAVSGIGDADTVYLDGVRCLAVARRLARPGRRLVCDFDDLMSRRARLHLAAGEPPNTGHIARQVPAWLRGMLRLAGGAAQRYEAWTLAHAERELASLCDMVVLLSPTESATMAEGLAPALATRVARIPPAQAIIRPGTDLASPLRFIFVGGENLSQNRLTLLRLFRLWAKAPPGRELHWFGRREPNGIIPPPGVVCHGFVADLAAAAYDGHSVLLNPSALAGGVKTKMLEALAHGCPAVGNPAAFEGVDWPDYPLLLGDDDAVWSGLIADPEGRIDDLRRGIAIGQRHLRDEHDPQAFEHSWRRLLGMA